MTCNDEFNYSVCWIFVYISEEDEDIEVDVTTVEPIQAFVSR